MATTIEFPINIFMKDNKIFAEFENLNSQINVVDNSVNTVVSTLEKKLNAIQLNNIIDMIGKVGKAFQSLVGSSLEFEKQQQDLKTLLKGDADATAELVKNIGDYSNATGVARGSLVEAQKTMMSFGLSADTAFGSLQNIADIAMGDSGKIQSLSLAFAQMSSTGKLTGQDLMQMINAGFNPLAIMAEKTGTSIGELKEQMGKGAISAEMVAQAFQWATEEGGQFFNGAAAGAETTQGKIAKMKASIDNFKIGIFQATGGMTAYVAEIGSMAGEIANIIPLFTMFGNAIAFVTNAQKMQALWAGICATATKVWVGVQGFLNLALWACPVTWIVAGIIALIAVIAFLAIKIKGWGTLWEAIVGFITNITKGFVEIIKHLFTSMVNGIMIAIDKIKIGWYKFKEAVGIGDSSENKNMIAQINADVEARKKAIVDGAKKVIEYQKAAFKSWEKVDLKWDKKVTLKSTTDKLKAQLGINDNTTQTVNNNNTDLSNNLSTASESINAGGKTVKNFNITVNDGLIKQVDNHFAGSGDNPETAGDFMFRLSQALQMILNDVNYAAT